MYIYVQNPWQHCGVYTRTHARAYAHTQISLCKAVRYLCNYTRYKTCDYNVHQSILTLQTLLRLT